MDLRVIALLLSLSAAALSYNYADEQEQACSFGGMKYLCENYEICSEFGLIDEDAKNILCGAYLDELYQTDPTDGPGLVTTPETDVEDETERPSVDADYASTNYYSTPNAITTREAYTAQTTDPDDSDSFTTNYFTTEAEPTIDPEIVQRPPVITVRPVNITVAPGGTGEFDCEAKAAMTPQITLTKKEYLSRPNLEYFHATGSGHVSQTAINSITINNVDKTNEGWYTCLACNRHGCDEVDAYLTVLDLCEGVTCPGEKKCVGDYAAGHGHTCECPSFCDRLDMFVNDWVCSNYCEEKFNECVMKEEACRNNQFEVEVMNKGRCGKIEDPVILEEEYSFGVFELDVGGELFLECNAEGFPEPEIVWYRDDEIVGYGNYLIKTVAEDDAGEYTCEAVNCMTTKVSKRLAAVVVKEIPPPPPVVITTAAPVIPTTESSDNFVVETPRATCAVFGDPHFLTYDQKAYTYMGMCDNVLAMDCETARWFVYGRMRPCGKTGGSCLESVTVYLDGEILELQRGWLVNRNGKKIVTKNRRGKEIVVKGNTRDITLLFDGAMLTLTAIINTREIATGTFQHDKLVVRWDGYVSVQIQTPINIRTCGMCGNNDGAPENDLTRTRRGVKTDNVNVFGDSWQLGRCPETQKAKTSEEVCGERFLEVRMECERLFSISKFQGCIAAGHDTAKWIDSCVYDECEGLLKREELPPRCVVAQAYVTQCGNSFWEHGDPVPRSSAGNLDNWEVEAGCPDETERFEPILDTGCPQPTLEEELAGDF